MTAAPDSTAVTRTPAASNVAAAMKDALFAGLIALGVFGPLIGFKTTQDMQNRLIVETRYDLLAIIVLIVFAGRFLLSLYLNSRSTEVAPARAAFKLPDAVARGLPPAGLVVLLVYPLMIYSLVGGSGALKWIDNFGIQILIYVMLAWGLNIVVGLAGLLDLGYVAFYAVGAYAYALLATQVIPATFPGLGIWAFWICLPVAGILAAFWGVLLGFPVLRLRGDYLAIVTLAFGEIIRLVLINWKEFSNGYEGISSIPRPSFFGTPFNASDTGFAAVWGLEFTPVYRTIFLYYVIVCLSPPSPSAPCSAALPAPFSPRARASSRRRASPSWNRRRSSPSSCSAAWARWSEPPSPPSP